MKLKIDQALQKGIEAHKAGKLQDAEKLYRAILHAQPTHPDANHNLGALAVSMNKAEVALPFFKTALKENPKVAQFWLSYIDALIKARQFGRAKQSFGQAKTHGIAVEELDALQEQLALMVQTPKSLASGQKSISGYPERQRELPQPKAAEGLTKENLKAKNPSQNLLNSILDYYQSGRLSDAESLAVEVTKDFPECQLAWKILGAIYKQTARNIEALDANKKAVILSPLDAEAYSNLGTTLSELGRLDEAEANYRKAIALNPIYAEAHFNLGGTLIDLGRLEDAEACLKRAVALNPDFSRGHKRLGDALRGLSQLDKAEESFRQAISLDPRSPGTHYNLGNTLADLGKLEEAATSFRQAISLDPGFANAHNNLGTALKGLAKLEEAELSYKQAILLNDNFSEAHYNLGFTLEELGRLQEAEASYNQAIALSPEFEEAHYKLGVLLYARHEYSRATEEFELVNSKEGRQFSIKCSYHHDHQSVFEEKLNSLINQGEIDAVIGSLVSCSEIKYGIKRPNPFCNDPLSYVITTNLKEQLDFEDIFIGISEKVLKDESVSLKAQGQLTNGVQTSGNIFSLGPVIRSGMESIIREEIEKYRRQFLESEEGFMTSWPSSYNLFGWLISMKSGGKLDSHIHETSWLTGCVYINVPPKLKADMGSLVVSLSDQSHGAKRSERESIIDVETGSLCLFPASLHHYTIPFESDEDRIVLAFDVVPKA